MDLAEPVPFLGRQRIPSANAAVLAGLAANSRVVLVQVGISETDPEPEQGEPLSRQGNVLYCGPNC